MRKHEEQKNMINIYETLIEKLKNQRKLSLELKLQTKSLLKLIMQSLLKG